MRTGGRCAVVAAWELAHHQMAGLCGGITYLLNAIHRGGCFVLLRSIWVSSNKKRDSAYGGFVMCRKKRELRGQEVFIAE